jgi:hypothetical protein
MSRHAKTADDICLAKVSEIMDSAITVYKTGMSQNRSLTTREILTLQEQLRLLLDGINLERRVALKMVRFALDRKREIYQIKGRISAISDGYLMGAYSNSIADYMNELKGLRLILRRAGLHA